MARKVGLFRRLQLAGRMLVGASTAPLHEAAGKQRRLKGWQATDDHVNTILQAEGAEIVRRARQQVANNPYASSASDAYAAALVGNGITPVPQLAGTSKLEEDIKAAWRVWCKTADADGTTNFCGLQALAARALFDSGEVLFRIRPRRRGDGLEVPFQLQALESDHLDRTFSQDLPSGHRIRSGIEFDLVGRRVAYHLWPEHPGDSTLTRRAIDRRRVAAEDIIHVYWALRPGQIRGMPRIAPSLVRLYLLDQYDDAELARKKVAALVAAWITRPELDDDFAGKEEDTDQTDDIGIANWEPGSINLLEPGEEVTISEPADLGGSYEAFQLRNLLAIAAGAGVPYAALTHDVSRANYSSQRAAMVEFRKAIEQQQQTLLIPQLLERVWARFVRTAILAGRLAPEAEQAIEAVRYITPHWPWVDPLKDRQAEVLAVDAGFRARSDVIAAEGADPEAVDQRRAADRERSRELGLQEKSGTSTRSMTEGDDEEDTQDDEEREAA